VIYSLGHSDRRPRRRPGAPNSRYPSLVPFRTVPWDLQPRTRALSEHLDPLPPSPPRPSRLTLGHARGPRLCHPRLVTLAAHIGLGPRAVGDLLARLAPVEAHCRPPRRSLTRPRLRCRRARRQDHRASCTTPVTQHQWRGAGQHAHIQGFSLHTGQSSPWPGTRTPLRPRLPPPASLMHTHTHSAAPQRRAYHRPDDLSRPSSRRQEAECSVATGTPSGVRGGHAPNASMRRRSREHVRASTSFLDSLVARFNELVKVIERFLRFSKGRCAWPVVLDVTSGHFLESLLKLEHVLLFLRQGSLFLRG